MSRLSYRLTELAVSDVDHIWESIAQNNFDAADRMVEKIHEQIHTLTRFPNAGHTREDLAPRRSLLFCFVGKYMIAYQVRKDVLLVIRILHSARNIPAILRHRKAER